MTSRPYCSKCKKFHSGKCAAICELCGKAEAVTRRLYLSDNGEISNDGVCDKCAATHSRLIKEATK